MNDMLTIIEIAAREDGGHGVQSQSGRKECWMEGWIAVPKELEQKAWGCSGYCELNIQDGVLVDIIPGEVPEFPHVPTEEEKLQAQVASLEGQLTDTQMALCDVYELLVPGDGGDM